MKPFPAFIRLTDNIKGEISCIKKYQPGRPDLLINTDWGIPRDGLTKEEAKSKNLLLFQNQWVTRKKKQLKDEQSAYVSIRIIGYLLLFICVPVLINIRSIAEGGIEYVALAVFYAFAASVSRSGSIRYARYARYPAILIFLSFILPFMPLFESEKRRTAAVCPGRDRASIIFCAEQPGKYLWPQTRANRTPQKDYRPCAPDDLRHRPPHRPCSRLFHP
ncbi:MAG: hypothetical protein MZV70_43525 [Desulfobacterales bacterium]|nr:hypothetical protein [Desulfobacterales bacterium]